MSPTFSQGEGILSISEFLQKISNIDLEDCLVKNNKNIEYYNLPAAFDIEVSSFYQGEKKPENKRAIMYIWQFGIFNYVTCGRTWSEFISFLKVLSKVMDTSLKRRLVVYVHNLTYEFQFIRKRLDWDEVFFLKYRKPVYCTSLLGIEFKCSLKLSGKKLEDVAKDLMNYPVKKMVGYLDYNKIRTPLTLLTQKEVLYCENDIRVLLSYIQEKIEQDGDITKIPLTNTGYVRNYCRKYCYSRWNDYRKIMQNLTVEPDEYSQLERAFQGGFTHANAHYVDKTLYNVGSHDFISSYPGVMVTEKFPMSRSTLVARKLSVKDFKYYLLSYCCLFELEMFEVLPKRFQEHPLSRHKCYVCEGAVVDNGRIVSADHIMTTVTEQDFFVYCEFYFFSDYDVKNLRIYEKNYLPKRFVLSMLELYKKKTVLKDVEGEEVNYMISKTMINAGFGMSVTKIVREELVYCSDGTFPRSKPDLASEIEKYNNNIRRFLYYPWGVWITAYARANLFSGVIACGDDYVYSDTDSIKSINTEKHIEYFNSYNAQMLEKIRKASEYQKIDISMFSPKNKKGATKTIGLWEYEGVYEKFKTLGAKRYLTFRMEERKPFEDNGMTVQLTEPTHVITLAGSNKKKTITFLRKTGKPFENFKNGITISSQYSGRLTLTYIDDETEGDIVDMYGIPYHYHELSSVHMEPSEYHLSRSEEFVRYLEEVVDFGE